MKVFVLTSSGVVGAAIAGLIGVLTAAKKRPLHDAERAVAAEVFGTSLDPGRIRIAESRIIAFGGNAKALPRTIFFPPGRPGPGDMAWLVHELTHSWQYQHGVSLFTTIWYAIKGDYEYEDLTEARARGRRFRDFNTEEQGQILRHYYEATQSGIDTSAFDPFVAEVRAG